MTRAALHPPVPHPPIERGAPIGIIAGAGALPGHLAGAATGKGHRVALAPLTSHDRVGILPKEVEIVPARIEKLGGLFDAFRARGIADVLLAGALDRPPLDPTAFDETFLRHAPRLLGAIGGGDDGLLRAVIAMIEAEGFRVRGPWEIAPDLLPPEGVLTPATPQPADADDAARAAAIHAAMGAADIGQACVVAGGLCLGVETIEGTDALLRRIATDPAIASRRPQMPRGILFKAPKPCQEMRADMPAIGPETVRKAAGAGLGGIVIEAGGVMVLDRAETIAEAEAAGLFLWVRPREVHEAQEPETQP